MNEKAGLPAEASAKAGPKDVFLHLLSIVALYVSAGSFIALLFQYINVFFPDPVDDGYYRLTSAYSGMRWSVAILVVVFPVYLWASQFLGKMYAALPERRELKTRKWLLYFTLFAAALIIIGDLVTLIYNFLQGELTARFLLKILAVGVVAGVVFSYYFLELRERFVSYRKYFAYGSSALVLAAAVLAFFVVGSPQEERLRRFDGRRISDLQVIQGQIINFWQNKERLPKNLAELRDDISGFLPPGDPESRKEYVYEKIADLSFKLCANFNRPSLEDNPKILRPAVPYQAEPYFGGESWRHKEGHVCFERKIDPEIYRPIPKEKR
ncbi:MAG: DUF5671 domain-containing protein [bacterium]|nr:DUF5671 domain-containing protein [bacterium]